MEKQDRKGFEGVALRSAGPNEAPLRSGPTDQASNVPNASADDDLLNMDHIIRYLETVPESAWCVDWCGIEGKDGNHKFCIRGHLLVYGEAHGHRGFDALFHEIWATEYMYYSVNDGKDPDYQQPTIKGRVLAYLRDLRDGKRKTTQQLFREDEVESMAQLLGIRVSDGEGATKERSPSEATEAKRTPEQRDGHSDDRDAHTQKEVEPRPRNHEQQDSNESRNPRKDRPAT